VFQGTAHLAPLADFARSGHGGREHELARQ
jgi:hypothetical protein